MNISTDLVYQMLKRVIPPLKWLESAPVVSAEEVVLPTAEEQTAAKSAAGSKSAAGMAGAGMAGGADEETAMVDWIAWVIVGLLAAWLSWNCNSQFQVGVIWKIIYSLLAFLFGWCYLCYYIFIRSGVCQIADLLQKVNPKLDGVKKTPTGSKGGLYK